MSKKRVLLSDREKLVIKNLNTFLKELSDDLIVHLPTHRELVIKYSDTISIIKKITKVPPVSVYKIISENSKNSENNIIKNDVKKKGRKKIICDSFIISQIRRTTLEFYKNKQYPYVHNLHKKCLEINTFPQIGINLFRKWIKKDCKMKFRKVNKKPVFLERHDIVKQRQVYLKKITNFRAQNRKIFYTDETWTSPDQSINKSWQIFLKKEEIKEFKDIWFKGIMQDMNGFTGGLIVKGGTGRVIINHLGSEDGFLEEAEDIFISKNDSKDYHRAMNSQHYIDWFQNKVCPNLPPRSVIVMDQAPYHKARVEDTIMPKLYWKKCDIINNLVLRKIELPSDFDNFTELTKQSLLSLSNKFPVELKFKVEEIAESFGHDVLWLPVAHCEFNPIELIWAYAKMYVSKNNTIGGNKEVLKHTKDAIKQVSADLWKKCISHAIKYEQEMKLRDNLIESELLNDNTNPKPEQILKNKIIINLAESSSESEFDSDTDDESENDIF